MSINALSSSAPLSKPNQFKYNGKEFQPDFDIGWYDYGARNYDAQLGRFFNIDRFSEKYYSMNPYQYGANNPIFYVDVNGDSIEVAERYREQFNNDLAGVFGDKVSEVGFSDSGALVFNGNVKDFKGKERRILKKLLGVIGSEETVNVAYEESVVVYGQEISVNDQGGAMTLLAEDLPNISESLIAISPTAPTESTALVRKDVTDAKGEVTGTKFEPEKFTANSSINLFHELGHVIFRGASQGPDVIAFDNLVRSVQKVRNADGTYKRVAAGARSVDITHDGKGTGATKVGGN